MFTDSVLAQGITTEVVRPEDRPVDMDKPTFIPKVKVSKTLLDGDSIQYVEMNNGKLPPCLTMSLAAYIAFYSNDIVALEDRGLVCRRPKGNEYVISDDRWALQFYYDHRDDSIEALVHAVLTNTQMWDQDLTKVEGLEATVVNGLKMIREKGAKAAFASCL